MGTFSVEIEVGDDRRSRFVSVDALVDTGASYTMLPAPVLESLDVKPTGTRRFVLASGEMVTRRVGQAAVRFDGRDVTTVVVFGEDGGPHLLGAVTLEEMGLGVDPLARRLIEVPGLLT